MPQKQGRWLTLGELVQAIKATGSAENTRVVLAISGGGATGAYEAGVMRALLEGLEEGQQPIAVTGSSAGALNALGWLVQRMHAGFRPPSDQVSFGYQVWEIVGQGNRGGRYVVGADFLIQAVSRLSALRLGPPTGRRDSGLVPGDLLLVAVLAIALLAGNAQQMVGHLTFWPWILDGALLCLVPLLILVALRVVLAQRALFLNRALTSTLANILDGDAPNLQRERSEEDVQALGRNWVAKWVALGEKAPGFILTGTDLTTQGEVLFSLVSPTAFQYLASEEWQVFQFDPGSDAARAGYGASPGGSCGFVAAEAFVQCNVASTSIPGVFPPQRIELRPLNGAAAVAHDVVDGGVLNNSPIHVAIDLKATHVISLELDPLVDEGTFEVKAPETPMTLPQDLTGTLGTLLRQTTSEDIRRASSWNRHLPPADQVGHAKRLVHLYRVAPRLRRLGMLDFDGHYPKFTGSPDPSLKAWLDQGYEDTKTLALFWEATFEAAPSEPSH